MESSPIERDPPSAGKASASVEDYLKAVYHLQAGASRATTQELARMLGVQMASVTGKIKQLHASGYVDHQPYQGVILTEKGRQLALRVLRRHRLIELFLQRALGLTWDEVHEDAEQLEHAVSDRLIERIDAFLGEPVFDPHGAPIPQSDGTIRAVQGVPLSHCHEGHRGEVLQVSDKSPELLRYLSSLGIRIGLRFEVVQCAPFGGPITVQTDQGQISLGPPLAEQVFVSS